jgi:predicted nucleic acid-binding protein
VIVLDASVLANAVGDDEEAGRQARDLLAAQGELAAPELVDVETTAVLRRGWLAGAITDDRFGQCIDDLAAMPIVRYPVLPLLRRVFELRANVTAYDACYVALAETLDCPFWTADHRLANAAGPRCPIKVITAGD